MKATIITIGDEILIGQIVDTNSTFIAKSLTSIGITVREITSIQDDKNHILDSLAFAKANTQLVIITGGLGPTKDDVTKHTLCEFMQDTLVENAEVLAHVEHLFKTYIKKPMLPANRTQALVPSKAEVLLNRFGTAPGMWMEQDGVIFVSLPGVPYEMKGLMELEVLPKLKQQFKLPFIMHKTLLTYGEGESRIAERLEEFEDALPATVKLAYLPSLGRVRLRLSTSGKEESVVKKRLQEQLDKLHPLIDDIFVGYEDEGAFEQVVAKQLVERGLTLAIAESCTGGQLVERFTALAGASQYLRGGLVTYATDSKVSILGVQQQTIETHSVVSEEVAIEMAKNARTLYQSDIAIATTGNAGPTKGDADAPVGTVYIGIASGRGAYARYFMMGNHRERVIGKTVNKALELLQEEILKN